MSGQLRALQEVSNTLQSKLDHTQKQAEHLRDEISRSVRQKSAGNAKRAPEKSPIHELASLIDNKQKIQGGELAPRNFLTNPPIKGHKGLLGCKKSR